MSSRNCFDRGFASIGKYALGYPQDRPTQDSHIVLGIVIGVSAGIFLMHILEILTGVPRWEWLDPLRERLRRWCPQIFAWRPGAAGQEGAPTWAATAAPRILMYILLLYSAQYLLLYFS